jgi:hypothetical protein
MLAKPSKRVVFTGPTSDSHGRRSVNVASLSVGVTGRIGRFADVLVKMKGRTAVRPIRIKFRNGVRAYADISPIQITSFWSDRVQIARGQPPDRCGRPRQVPKNRAAIGFSLT